MLAAASRRFRHGTALALVALLGGAPGGLAQAVAPVTLTQAPLIRAPLPAEAAFGQAVAAAAAEDEAVAGFYRDRGYRPLWTGAADAGRRAALLAALDGAGLHALPEGRHDAAALVRQFQAAATEGDRGRAEVAMTRAFLSYAREVQSGILTPGKIDKGIVREVPLRDRREQLDAFAAADPVDFLRALPPQHPEYARLVKARLALLSAVERGGWGPAVPAKALRPGQQGQAVVALRDRLMRMGYLGRTATQIYDAAIQAAVQEFQFDHGLTADGVAGEATLAEINQPPVARLRAVTVAMERERWTNIERGKRHIWVNLTDFSAKIVDDGKVTFATRAVVGSTIADKRTPEFSHRMTYMEVNPDWTVPPGIIRRDYLPRLQANPGALGHLQVVDSRGRVVPRSAVNFAAYTAGNFPYNLRQPPGPTNSLGRVKFMFPNPWSIYLHDTPEKHLFQRESRAYSSGCVRLNDPFDFAYILLAPQEADPRAAFHRVLDSGRQERIFLKEPVPVHLEYRTAFTTAKGRVNYRRDIYGRDAAIWQALADAGVAQVAEGG
ncbi:L,D-transpeptidase family protein [Ruixingdingia sedimenti]|uniref:L,D-transpeptidase family protein n=1 Tax=Ruixingdingia sedimenti TaxID=3073604 RepID=A0ABU1F4M2_9RHOB|nr:L,D-transpeptidase family protein [Xinfangfangia sp. LG-4]MDR5651814.1 L,D-transpeptidase family protein [Xinfangfangia sp. LG-4]